MRLSLALALSLSRPVPSTFIRLLNKAYSIAHRSLLSRAQLETKLRLMCPVRTTVTRVFDAKLVVGGGLWER